MNGTLAKCGPTECGKTPLPPRRWVIFIMSWLYQDCIVVDLKLLCSGGVEHE
jgi:hypothetical protein